MQQTCIRAMAKLELACEPCLRKDEMTRAAEAGAHDFGDERPFRTAGDFVGAASIQFAGNPMAETVAPHPGKSPRINPRTSLCRHAEERLAAARSGAGFRGLRMVGARCCGFRLATGAIGTASGARAGIPTPAPVASSPR